MTKTPFTFRNSKKNDKERNVVFPSNMDKLYKDFSQITVSMTMGK